jgi:hypothetical protein
MAKKRQISVAFPLGGLNRRGAYKQQRTVSPLTGKAVLQNTFTTPDCLNVRPSDPIEGRERGGSRPGLIASYLEDLGGPVRMLFPMTIAPGDGFTAWSDTFSGSSMAAAWTQASWASNMPSILPSALASVDTSVSNAAAVRDTLTIDVAEAYIVELFITPWSGAHHGVYRLYLRMDDTTPAYATDGVEIELFSTGTAGSYSGTLKSYTGGVESVYSLSSGSLGSAQPGWLAAQVTGNEIKVYWCGVLLLTQTVSAHTGKRAGFGMECTEDGGVCLANVFRVQYYSTESVDALRTLLIASADGNIWKETLYGRMSQISTSLTLRDGAPLASAQSGQKLYIADYGDVRTIGTDGSVGGTVLDATGVTDWTALGISVYDDVVVISNPLGTAVAGTYKISSVAAGSVTLASDAGIGGCAYRIERSPKVFDPLTDTVSILTATAGQVPAGCPLICRYLDRIVLAGAEVAPHVWYMSRQGAETDWDYSQADSQRAVAGTSSEAGVPGSAITALVPHSDDYLVMGCRHSLWRLRGDPAYGGSLDVLSHTIGIIGRQAWCLGPSGELIFLSLDGIYALAAGGDTSPVSLSREVLPQEFLNLNPDSTTISLEYDVIGRGVHIFLSPESSNARLHWWFDFGAKTFWPITLKSGHEPMATCPLQSTAIEDSGVILGGRDGKLRRFSELAETDCGTAFASYVMMGPIALAKDSKTGTIMSVDAVMAGDSGPVAWGVRSAPTFEGAVTATAISTGTWVAGLNATVHPAGRGQAFALKLTGAAGRKWAMEQVTALTRESGRRRIL